MKRLTGIIFALLTALPLAHARDVGVEGMRMWTAPDSTRIVFDVSAPANYQLFRLSGPDRIVIDFDNARVTGNLEHTTGGDQIVRGVRHALRGSKDLRVVLDVNQQIQVKHFLLSPNDEYGYRLVVDLVDPAVQTQPQNGMAQVRRAAEEARGTRDIVIAIDPGHGGEDPGARGATGLNEKDVVLAIARQLHAMMKKEPGIRPVLIRDGDYFVSLRQRTLKAREHKADLLISIHADAFRDKRVRGGSLFVLSQNGASSEAARWLAERANASDLVGGVRLEDKDDVLASVLLDLSQSATAEASHVVAEAILHRMSPIGKLHRPAVQQAGFAVLKSPDIPSVLIETAFISNPEDEARLRTARYQQQVAQAIFNGARDYFTRHPPTGTLYASRREHIITRGDTLSQLAQQYRVSVERLRSANQLNSDVLRVGQVLHIPGS